MDEYIDKLKKSFEATEEEMKKMTMMPEPSEKEDEEKFTDPQMSPELFDRLFEQFKANLKKRRFFEKLTDKWLRKFHSLSPEQRDAIVRKINRKYNSEEYLRSRNAETGNMLYEYLFEYGRKYGEDAFHAVINGKVIRRWIGNYFVVGAYVFDKTWYVQCVTGQGTVFDCCNVMEDFNESNTTAVLDRMNEKYANIYGW